jgi:hypothetical protein
MDDTMSSASTIPVLQNTRNDRSRRSRGHDANVLAQGVSARAAIAAANEAAARADDRAARLQHELDACRAKLGRSEDSLRSHLNTAGAGAAVPNGLPPDLFATELLRRDALLLRWTGSYQKLVEASAIERAERKSERERLEADIRRLERRADRVYNENRDRERRDRRSSPDPALAEARRERDDALASRDASHVALGAAKLTFRNDVNYYLHKTNLHRAAELDAQKRFLDQRQLVLELQAQLQQTGASVQPLPPAPIFHDTSSRITGTAFPAPELDDALAFANAHCDTDAFDDLSFPSRSSRAGSPSSDFRPPHCDSPTSDSRSSSRRT